MSEVVHVAGVIFYSLEVSHIQHLVTGGRLEAPRLESLKVGIGKSGYSTHSLHITLTAQSVFSHVL